MKKVFVRGIGAVSPAGWGVPALVHSLERGEPLSTETMQRPLWPRPVRYRPIPNPECRPGFLSHPRFRRTSLISQCGMAVVREALGLDKFGAVQDYGRLGLIFCVMAGCVNYSRRFYEEIMVDPATASPLVFPETVFNAPASHIASLLNVEGINYTLVGDQGTFLQGISVAAGWLADERVDACLVIAAEEVDWTMLDAFRMFNRNTIIGTGAGALLLTSKPFENAVELSRITSPQCFSNGRSRRQAVQQMRSELPCETPEHLLCDSRQNIPALDAAETAAWADWHGARLSPKAVLGEGLMASTAWQCAAAIDRLRRGQYAAATISTVGSNQQAIGAQFVRSGSV